VTAPLPISLFEYDLPEDRIAQVPARPRDSSRLMRVHRCGGETEHHCFADLPGLLQPADLLVVNATEVIRARLSLRRPTGGQVELLLCRPIDGGVRDARVWSGLARPASAFKRGRTVLAADGTELIAGERLGEQVTVRSKAPLWQLMQSHGEVPLPPYIRRPDGPKQGDVGDYQTLFAKEPGAVAAPTASLHFTERVLGALDARDVKRASLVLHVGPGTFVPVRNEHAEDIREHVMHGEWYDIPEETVLAIEATKARGGRVIGVGTTSVRAMESWSKTGNACGEATLFIYPGYEFGVIDGMITNFHLPRSTLLMMVSAFAGRDLIIAAYEEAVREGYRFFSYGDAMLLL